jgi:hypothetical protein
MSRLRTPQRYVLDVTGAKTPQTRERRLAKAIGELRQSSPG